MWRLGDHLTFWAFNEPIFWTDATLLEIKHNTNSVLNKTVLNSTSILNVLLRMSLFIPEELVTFFQVA